MNDKQDYSDIGERISGALKDAVETKDFRELNRVVTDTVNGAVEEVRRQVNTISQSVSQQASERQYSDRRYENRQTTETGASEKRNTTSGQTQSYAERYRYTYRQPGSRTMYASQRRPQGSSNSASSRTEEQAAGNGQSVSRSENQTALKERENTGVRINRSGKVGGILQVVFGGIGTGTFALVGLANLLVWAFEQTFSAAVPVAVMAALCAVSGGFIANGCKILGRLKRAERYAKLGSKKMFLELEDIARNTGRSLKKVRTDVRKMLRLGIFPEGHMDSQESCLILDDETWQQYKITQKEYENRKALEDKSVKADGSADVRNTENTAENVNVKESSVTQIVREGQAYMDRLRQLNIEIPGEVISNKLYQLDYLLTRIFAVIREHPENCPQMRKFMEYYLPTTVKLVESYADFDKAGVQGENITSAKAEIEKTMDTINQAFEKLLDDIYLSQAMETAADAQVLKTLLAQDGYTKSDFELK